MYWPVGSPRVYALSHDSEPQRPDKLDDDLNAVADDEAEQDEKTEHDEKAKEEDDFEKLGGSKDVIRDLQLARNGLLFGTITRNGLAVWQVRVCYCSHEESHITD
jgi:hypothetical protein